MWAIKRNYISYVTVFIIALTLTGCQVKLPESIPDIGVPAEEVNTRIHLTVLGVTDGIVKNQDGLTIEVDVVTSDYIEFPYDYGVQLFIYQDDQWTEIVNNVTYPEYMKEPVKLPFSGEYPIQAGFADVSPYSPNLEKEVPLRVIVVGNIIRDGETTEEKTAGFIDLTLKP